MYRTAMRAGGLLCLALSVSVGAFAQDNKNSREREALRRAQQQVQKTNQELATLRQQADATAQERDALAAKVDGAETRARAESVRGQRLQRELTAMTAERDALKTRGDELDQRLKESTARAAQLERDLALARQHGQRLTAQEATQRDQIAACEKRNAQLYDTGRALVEECRDRSASDTVLRLEPFTGIGRVRIQNMLETYRDKLDEHKTPAQVATP